MSYIYSTRFDGLGQRLCALLYAKVISQQYGYSLRFNWKSKTGPYGQFHSVETANQIFSKSYLLKHLTKREYEDVAKDDSLSSLSDFIQNDLSTPSKDIFVDSKFVPNGFQEHKKIFSPERLRTAFESIDFSESIKNSLNLASNAITGANPVAIHVRGGDIVYGPFLKYLRFQMKAVPVYLLAELANDLSIDGLTPVIFLQDPKDRIHFEHIKNVVFSTDLNQGRLKNRSEIAFFDFYLMSRCQTIYSGNSGFSRLAAMISGSEIIDVWNQLRPEKVREKFAYMLENKNNFNSNLLLHFFSSYYIYLNCGFDDVLTEKTLKEFSDSHPQYGVISMILLHYYLSDKNYDSADKTLNSSLTGFEAEPIENPLIFSIIKSSSIKRKFIETIPNINKVSKEDHEMLYVLSFYFSPGKDRTLLCQLKLTDAKAILLRKLLVESDAF